MPVLSKFRLKTPFDEFENYLGEEMNTFSGFFKDNYVEEEIVESIEETIVEKEEEKIIQKSLWNRLKQSIFKFSSELFQ
jgi:hypothetical protein